MLRPLSTAQSKSRSEVLGEERQILRGQLVLQRLGGGRDDDGRARLDRRHEVGERLAGAGPGLDHEVAVGPDGVGDPFGHLDLPEPGLGAGERGGDPGEGVGDHLVDLDPHARGQCRSGSAEYDDVRDRIGATTSIVRTLR